MIERESAAMLLSMLFATWVLAAPASAKPPAPTPQTVAQQTAPAPPPVAPATLPATPPAATPPPTPPLAPVQVLDLRSPAAVAAALKALGYRADMSKDVFGNARIASGNASAQFGFDFHGCQDSGRCVLVMLVKSYADDPRFQSSKGDAWNSGQHVASVGMDGDFHPALELPVSLEKVADQTALADAIKGFLQAQADFERFLGS
jgi:hypothetical protein